MESQKNWSNLPKDILILIINLIDSPTAYQYPILRAVCPSWRSSLPLPASDVVSPHLHFQPLNVPIFNQPQLPSAQIVQKIFFHVEPHMSPIESGDPAWIVQVEEVGPKRWSFFNPLTGNKLTLPPDQGSADFLKLKLTELGRSFSLRCADGDLSRKIRKVICSSTTNIESSMFMALCDDEDRTLAFYKPGFTSWVSDHFLNHDLDILIEDIVFHNGRFYAVDEWGKLFMIDPSKWWKPIPVVYRHLMDGGYLMYLVVSHGSLYLVCRDITTPGLLEGLMRMPLIKLYVLKEEEGAEAEWKLVTNVGDQVLFICQDHSFSLSSGLVDSKYKNCIFLHGKRMQEKKKKKRGGCGFGEYGGNKLPWNICARLPSVPSV